jgi:small subunit ribosomal protein S11
MVMKKQPRKKKKLKVGYLYIKCSLKNTIITFKNKNKFLYQTSSKASKLKHKRKNNAFIIKKMSHYAANFIKKRRYHYLLVYLKGVGPGRFNALKGFSRRKFQTILFQERTATPFNGCKKRKVRRK